MARAAEMTVKDGLATLRICRDHGNAINDQLVEDLMTCCRDAEGDPEVSGMMLAASGKLFSPGLDLQELIELDRPTLSHFLQRFSASLLMLYTFPKPLVAAIHGHAVAGGCVLTLTADWRILRRGALIGLNEVKVGVPLPYGVAMMLRESVSKPRLEEVALFGRNYSDEAAVDAGLAHELHEEAGFEDHCRARLEELASRDLQAFAVTKRYLRSATVERIRGNDAQLAQDFLNAWFSDGTQERVRGIVAKLKG